MVSTAGTRSMTSIQIRDETFSETSAIGRTMASLVFLPFYELQTPLHVRGTDDVVGRETRPTRRFGIQS
jgi:hypothetical protein